MKKLPFGLAALYQTWQACRRSMLRSRIECDMRRPMANARHADSKNAPDMLGYVSNARSARLQAEAFAKQQWQAHALAPLAGASSERVDWPDVKRLLIHCSQPRCKVGENGYFRGGKKQRQLVVLWPVLLFDTVAEYVSLLPAEFIQGNLS